ncbi:MAG: hypothetical protein J5801_04945 [Bacteroidales bacterium]|nr:hypothetical protein [Bacteroidales bacterium]
MKKSFTLYIAAAAVCCMMAASCNGKKSTAPEFDYEALNAQAIAEYLQPVHPGVRGETPFWNKFATKYIYAPVFDFDDVENAKGYTYTAEAGGKFFVFDSESPRTPISEIWTEIPVGPVKLSVQAYDGQGVLLGEPQSCSFEKDNPFCGPYDPAPRGYRESAIRAAKALHDSPLGQSWANGKPDTTYFYNCYACKIWSGIAQTECFLAREVPEYHDEALRRAINACDCLIASAQPEGAPLAFFPPTYYYGENNEFDTSVLRFNVGKAMFLEPTYAANAILDLYDLTKEQKYLDHATGIAKTYQRLQAEDGSWPVKVNWETAEPINEARCLPADILMLVNRLKLKYGIDGFEDMAARAERWMWDNIIAGFNFNGQFEDVPIEDKVPYQNLTHCPAGDCIEYLMTKPEQTQKDLDACIEIARWAEDQFARWHSAIEYEADALSAVDSVFSSPFVFEQYSWKNPVDASIAKVALNFMYIYKKTGDLLCLAKAKALVDTLVKIQNPETGMMPTVPNSETQFEQDDIWANCVYYSIRTLMMMDSILGE